MTPHPQADLLRAIADGEQMQRPLAGRTWENINPQDALIRVTNGFEVRIAPKMRSIEGFEYPEPVTEPMEKGCVYFVPRTRGAEKFRWNDDDLDNDYLKAAQIHRTREAAEAHRAAIIKAGGGDV